MKSNYDLAKEVLSGLWGNGIERRERLTGAGYDYNAVQTIVNALVKDGNYTSGEPENKKQRMTNPLEIDYNPMENDGIIVNIIIERRENGNDNRSANRIT